MLLLIHPKNRFHRQKVPDKIKTNTKDTLIGVLIYACIVLLF